MNKRCKDALQHLCDSYVSAYMAVADHLESVASNGREYGTLENMRQEAEVLIEGAQEFLDLTRPRRKLK